jgi:hypothetical protein
MPDHDVPEGAGRCGSAACCPRGRDVVLSAICIADRSRKPIDLFGVHSQRPRDGGQRT